MKVFLVIAMMLAGENEPKRISIEASDMRACFEAGWRFVNGPLPDDLVFVSSECQARAGVKS